MCWHVLNFFNPYTVEKFNMKELRSDSQWFGVPFGDKEAKDLAERNAKRVEEAKEKMGKLYLLHPSNRVNRVSHTFEMSGN